MSAATIVVGGGAAGFFAAIAIARARPGGQVTILERGKTVLDKVRISGGGRCNVTHACWEPRELINFYPRGGQELLGPFHKFACGDTMAWFAERGIGLKIEEDGRVFPVSDNSQTIVDCLLGEARRLGVRVVTTARVKEVVPPDPAKTADWWTVHTATASYRADRLIVTTGSNPAVWQLLAGLGHTIVPPVPSLFALTVNDPALRALAGIGLAWAQVQVVGDRLKAEGPLLVTHKGLSGPAVLRLSAWGARQLHPLKYDFELSVNWLARRGEEVTNELVAWRGEAARRQIGSRAPVALPARLWQYLVEMAGVDGEQQWAQLSKHQLTALVAALTDSRYRVTGKATNKEEFTTAGGVDLREIDFRTFQSTIHPGLYLAGEVLDIDAITGGFNFQAAWTGAYLIGQAVA